MVQEGLWEIDEAGRIWILAVRRGKHVVAVQRRRAERPTPEYLEIRAMIDGVRVHGLAHRLVWQHFSGDIPDGLTVGHENGVKFDNRPANLKPQSYSEQMTHAHATGLLDQRGESNPAARLTDYQVAQIRLAYRKGGYRMQDLAVHFGVSFQQISRVIRGQQRASQAGPTSNTDHRHVASARDPTTGRFTGFVAP